MFNGQRISCGCSLIWLGPKPSKLMIRVQIASPVLDFGFRLRNSERKTGNHGNPGDRKLSCNLGHQERSSVLDCRRCVLAGFFLDWNAKTQNPEHKTQFASVAQSLERAQDLHAKARNGRAPLSYFWENSMSFLGRLFPKGARRRPGVQIPPGALFFVPGSRFQVPERVSYQIPRLVFITSRQKERSFSIISLVSGIFSSWR